MTSPKKPINSNEEAVQAHVRGLVECYSDDLQLLQQAIKDLERRISQKTQQIAIEKEVLSQLHERLVNWDKPPD